MLAQKTKRLVEIDDELLTRARAAASTSTIKATVETALRRLVDHDTALSRSLGCGRQESAQLAAIRDQCLSCDGAPCPRVGAAVSPIWITGYLRSSVGSVKSPPCRTGSRGGRIPTEPRDNLDPVVAY